MDDLDMLRAELKRYRAEFERSERDYNRLCEDWHASNAELKRYREREPLVQAVVELSARMESEDGWWASVRDALGRLRAFKLSEEP